MNPSPQTRPGGASAWAAALQAQWWRPEVSLAMRLLQPLAALFTGLAACHRWWQRRHAPATLGRPVLVVGNLVLGGAGKTPTVIALVQWLRQQGWQPGVVSRGYGRADEQAIVEIQSGATAGEVGDEPLLIYRRTGVPVVVGRNRVAAAQALLTRHPGIDIVLSDDGLQHHRLPRDVEVVVFDGRGAGNGLTLPAGPLRQRLPHPLPAQMLVLYNASRPSTPLPGAVAQRRLSGALPLAAWWRTDASATQPLAALQGRPLLAAAGMGDPERFFAMLEQQGLTIERLPLPDHASFSPLPWPVSTTDVLVTEKDAVKLRPDQVGATRVWVVALDFALPPDFTEALQQRLSSRVDRPPLSTRR
ncbi:MAG TPA: tetraacyldisaccharide 4'-kinase [Ideonella sp.]|uniref:tetraacyldisaccharide 4'-kinase n=1 Tax=Ideonella sp. TaxID=1929293 RepID=UPI002E330860|nr:tetraacyldisaccharide 4'-kinase [Ideonella sp.]HEX5684257.1 tetraacyldisaccharide 4'-kinase [Ideonella sp.]